MRSESEGQALIEAFLAALALRNLSECHNLRAQLRALADIYPTYQPWCSYFAGILANEHEHDWASAERIFSLLLQEDLDSSLRVRVLYALGRTYDYQGRWQEAIATFEQHLSIAEALGLTIEQAKAWKHMAISYRRGFTRGDYGFEMLGRAIAYCHRALDVLEPIENPSPDIAWLKGSVWNSLGLIHRSLGEWDQAIAAYQHDLAIGESLHDRFGMGLSYGNLAEIYQKGGREDWPAALTAYQQALQLIREFDNRYEETEALANLAFLHQEMGEHTAALGYYSQAIAIIEELRAGVSAEAARAGFFATVADTYANAVLLYIDIGDTPHAFALVERARSRAFLDLLAARSPDLPQQVEAATLTLDEAQAALPANALLLEYFTTGLLEVREGQPAPGVQRHRSPPAKTLAFAVTRESAQIYDLGISPNQLRPSQIDSAVERHFLDPHTRRALYDWLIAPVAAAIQGRRRLYLAPHGPLHYIPFQALLAPDGAALLREEGPQIVYGPSATVLFRYTRAEAGRAPAPCLALGYNGAGASRLRFAEEEARGVARLTSGRAIAGPMPKRAALYAQASDYRLLHLSCHGIFDPDAPLQSALELAPGEQLSALDVLEHLRLRCDLVTLSACESGLSRVRRGDELVGLVRAFLSAGAPALICTLWRVDERSTHILMERFYQEVQGGAGFAEALKRAQLYLAGVTRKQARAALVHALADEIVHPDAPAEASPSGPIQLAAPPQTRAYLKRARTTASAHGGVLSSGPDDECVFAEPYYWAPFILIGDQGN